MFCWPCIIVYQYNETNVTHFSFSLLRIKRLYMFRALPVHPQEAIHKRYLVCCVRVTIAVSLQSWHSQLALYARNIPSAVYAVPPEDGQVTLETCRGAWLSINWKKSASRWFHYSDKYRHLPYTTTDYIHKTTNTTQRAHVGQEMWKLR
jgi:hypothetical protein